MSRTVSVSTTSWGAASHGESIRATRGCAPPAGAAASPEARRRSRRSIRLYVVDDHAMFRELLMDHLDRRDVLTVVGGAGSAEQAVREVEPLRPDVVLLDYQLPGEDGISACPKILEAASVACVVVLTMFRRAELIDRALQAGARGFVTKGDDVEALEEAIRTVAAGGRFIDSGVAVRYGLTAHELAALALAAGGSGGRQIGAALGLSKNTVDTYLKRAAKKLGAANRAEAVAIAVREGLV